MIMWYMLTEKWEQPHNFLLFWVIFCPFIPLLALNINDWKKKKRKYFLFHMYLRNKDSWDIRHSRQKFLSFWDTFCLFIPLTNQKIKILKKWKKNLEILSFYICLPQMTTILCTVPEIWSSTGKIFSRFGLFLPFYWKTKFLKKKPGHIISLHLLPQMTIIWCMVP